MKKLLLDGLMKAISLHQMNLIRKTFAALRIIKRIRNENDAKIFKLRKIMAWNTKKTFFTKMVRVFKLRKLYIYKSNVATKHLNR